MIHESSETQHPIEWAMETDIDPYFMLANWLVRDAIEESNGAVATLVSQKTTLDEFRTLKRIFKQLRTQGELPSDRRLGARLYAASIAGALVFHDRLITVQASPRLRGAFEELCKDPEMPEELVALVRKATDALPE